MDKTLEANVGMFEADYSRYLTHSSEDENWQIVCTDVGKTRIPPGKPYPPHIENHPQDFRSVTVGRRINEYQMVYIVAGRGMLEMNEQRYSVETGNLFILFPGVSHSYEPDMGTGWTELWVGFRGPQADALQMTGVIDRQKPLYRPGYQPWLIGTFNTILELVKLQPPLYQFKVGAEILRLLAETLSLERLASQPSRAQTIAEKAKAFIEANLNTAFDLDRLGAEVHVSLPHLNVVFKAYTGMTPYQYCLHAKMNRAKEMLAMGQGSVKHVSSRLGFEDPYYFSRLFKKKTGVCPTQWTSTAPRHLPSQSQGIASTSKRCF